MELSQQMIAQIQSGFLRRAAEIPYLQDTIAPRLLQLPAEERIILEFYYGGMPLADLAGVEFNTLRSYAAFGAAQLRRLELPQEIFLNYIAQYRINTEDISFIRSYLSQEISPLLGGLSAEEAILEVNRWCACHMTYRLTDERTASPATSLRSGYGRCGEESSLLVEALRSVGIPARQVYTPKWAHCDDNHAWVEAWCEGRWRFLGACEPEPVLDKGWFNAAASRAMLVHTKVFGSITEEEVLSQEGSLTLLNQTHRYAPCKELTITVCHDGQPVTDAKIHLQLVNMAEAADIAVLSTTADGKAKVTLGLGSLLIRALHPVGWAEQLLDTSMETEAVLHLQAHEKLTVGIKQLTMHAPPFSDQNTLTLSPQQKAAHKVTLANCDAQRQAYTAGFYQNELAEQFPSHIQALLQEAKGNFAELYRFLTIPMSPTEEILKYPLLSSLTQKDYRDASCDVLLTHLKAAAPYQDKYPNEVFVPYLLCPRIGLEPLTAYREGLLGYLCPCEITGYYRSPKALWQRILELVKIAPHDDNLIPASPLATAYSGVGTARSAAVLMVAWCRALGIPARLDPVTAAPQYYNGECFVGFAEGIPQPEGQLTLESDGTDWNYQENWSLSVLKNHRYETLSLADLRWEDRRLDLKLHSGSYRLITTNRLPNGNQHLQFCDFALKAKKPLHIPLQLPTANIREMLSSVPLSSFSVSTLGGQNLDISDLLPQKGVIIWLETGREPSEHILNELIANSEALDAIGCPLCLLLSKPEEADYPLLQTLQGRLSRCHVVLADFADTAQPLARRMFTDPDKLPLSIVVDQGLTGVYASAGYNVGAGALMIKILQALNQQ